MSRHSTSLGRFIQGYDPTNEQQNIPTPGLHTRGPAPPADPDLARIVGTAEWHDLSRPVSRLAGELGRLATEFPALSDALRGTFAKQLGAPARTVVPLGRVRYEKHPRVEVTAFWAACDWHAQGDHGAIDEATAEANRSALGDGRGLVRSRYAGPPELAEWERARDPTVRADNPEARHVWSIRVVTDLCAGQTYLWAERTLRPDAPPAPAVTDR